MKTPFEILDVAADASDTQIKQAYLQKVKDNPPDRDQARFQSINNAYESIKDAKSRISYALFHIPDADFDALLDKALDSAQPLRIEPEQFVKLLGAGSGDAIFLNDLNPSVKP